MKKFVALITFLSVLSYTASADTDPILLDITIENVKPVKKSPRSIAIIPVSCVYNSIENTVYVDFTEDIGQVSVCVTNLYTGEITFGNGPSADGTMILYVPGTSGTYQIHIETEYGDMYEGTFTVE